MWCTTLIRKHWNAISLDGNLIACGEYSNDKLAMRCYITTKRNDAQMTCDTCINSYLTQSSRRKRSDKSQQTSILTTFLEFFSSSEWQLHRTLNTSDLTMDFATNRSELINVMTQTDCKYPKMFRVNWKWNCCWLLRTLRLKRSPPHQIITFKRNYLNLKLILSAVLIGNGVGYFTHSSTAECWRTHTHPPMSVWRSACEIMHTDTREITVNKNNTT